MLEIDGSMGEGGGQILRSAIALSAITQTPVKINNIRRNRPKCGLFAQHIAGIKTAGLLCGADISGLFLGSTEVIFQPQGISGGTHSIDIGTAGSITLVLQACLPVALSSPEPTILKLQGGTDVKYSPPVDYFKFVIKRLLERMDARIELIALNRGYYPKGGGELKVQITPPESGLKPLILEDPGKVEHVQGIIHIANLPGHISHRLETAVRNEFSNKFQNAELDLATDHVKNSASPGVGITLWADNILTVLGSSALGERGIAAEKLAANAVNNLWVEVISGATLDLYAADQLLPFLAVSSGSFLARSPLSKHAETNLNVIEQFFGQIFKITVQDKLVHVEKKIC